MSRLHNRSTTKPTKEVRKMLYINASRERERMRGKGKEDVALWACPSLLIYLRVLLAREKRGLVLPPTLPLLATPRPPLSNIF
jgi:hypothetical protein